MFVYQRVSHPVIAESTATRSEHFTGLWQFQEAVGTEEPQVLFIANLNVTCPGCPTNWMNIVV